MAAPDELLEHLREHVGILVAERDAAREAVERARSEADRLGHELQSAQRDLARIEEEHARARAGSLAGAGATEEAEQQALSEQRRRVWELQADHAQALRTTELLVAELEAAQTRLEEGATQAKLEAVEGVMGEAREAWHGVRTALDGLRAVADVEHGANPPIVDGAAAGAEEFERRTLDAPLVPAKPPSHGVEEEPQRPADRGVTSALRAALVVLGAAGMIAGPFLEWLRPYRALGVDLEVRAFYERSFFESTRAGRPSAGSVMIALGVTAIAALLLRVRWVPPLAGLLGVAGIVAYALAVSASAGVEFPSAIGGGAWLTLAGSVLLVVQPLVRLSPPPAGPAARPEPTPAETPPPLREPPAPGEPPPTGTAGDLARLRRTRRLRLARVIVGVVVLVVVALVVAENSQPVELRLLGGASEPRLVWVLLGAVIAGGAVGYLLSRPGEYLRWRRGRAPAEPDRAPASPVTLALRALVVAIVAIVIVVAAQNAHPVEIRLLVATFEPRLVWVLLGAVLAGGVVGYLLGRPGEYLRRT